MTEWPICVECRTEYIPIAALDGCPWCSGSLSVHPETVRNRQSEYNQCKCGGMKGRKAAMCWTCYQAHRAAHV